MLVKTGKFEEVIAPSTQLTLQWLPTCHHRTTAQHINSVSFSNPIRKECVKNKFNLWYT